MPFATDQQQNLTPETTPLYLAGWRVEPEPGGARLRFVDHFANRNEDFGLHTNQARAWEIARLLSGKPTPAFIETSARA